MTTLAQRPPTELEISALPRVTDVLNAIGAVDLEWVTEYALLRGTAVHLATQFDDEGSLDETTVVPEVAPRLAAWREFKRIHRPKMIAIETRVVNWPLQYRGTADRILEIAGERGVLDVKSGPPKAWMGLQVAGYALGFEEPLARWTVSLNPDGSYRLKRWDDRKDFTVFRSAVSVCHWKRSNA